MPARVWLWVGAAIAIPVLIFVMLTFANPRQEEAPTAGPNIVADNPPPGAPAVEAAAAGPAPAPAPPAPAAPAIDPALAAAFAATRTAAMPVVEGRATLMTVVADAGQVTFNYQLDIDAATYDLPDDSVPALSAIAPFACDDAVCFQLDERFIDRPCADAELVALLAAGATAVFAYRDRNGAELAVMPVTAAHCGL